MMKRVLRIIAVSAAGLIALCSCATNRYIAQDIGDKLHDIAVITPFAYINYIDETGVNAYDDSLSLMCSRLFTLGLLNSSLPTGPKITIDFDNDYPEFRDAVASLKDIDPRYAGEIPIPPILDSLLEANGLQYGVVVFANGFSRSRKNYVEAMATGLGIGILTTVISMGAVTTYIVPYKGMLNTWIGIIDAENDCFVYFNRRFEKDAEPDKPLYVYNQINRLLDHLELP
jgi:hypothetical protein